MTKPKKEALEVVVQWPVVTGGKLQKAASRRIGKMLEDHANKIAPGAYHPILKGTAKKKRPTKSTSDLTAVSILDAIAAGDGNIRRAAVRLRVHEVTVHNKIRALDLRAQVAELQQQLKDVLGMAAGIARRLDAEDGASVFVSHKRGTIAITVKGRKKPSASIAAGRLVVGALVRRLRIERPGVRWSEAG